jgi:hypothetical protein
VSPSSLLDLDPVPGGAFLLGCGGGGDIVQTIPVLHYLRRLGVRKFVLGEIALKWWDRPGHVPIGGEVAPLDWYKPTTRLGEHVTTVEPGTRLTDGIGAGQPLFEAEVAAVTGAPTVALSIDGGEEGFTRACRRVMRDHGLDLFVTVDIGADAFFSGTETSVQSPLADAMSVAAAAELGGVYAVTGYGCDAEMPLTHLQRNMAQVMAAGGYLGAHGLTPRDVEALTRVLDPFPHEQVETWPRDAARGRLGTQYCKGWWAVDVSPLAAVTLFFDPAALADLNPVPGLIKGTRSLLDAEEAILANTPLIPETRLPAALRVPTGTPSAD